MKSRNNATTCVRQTKSTKPDAENNYCPISKSSWPELFRLLLPGNSREVLQNFMHCPQPPVEQPQKATSAKPSEEYTRSMVARRPSTTQARHTSTVHSLMPGLIRTRNALATRRRSSGNKNPTGFGGRPEPASDDAATDPLDGSTSVHRRMDLLLAKSASVEEPKSAHAADGDLLRASTASTAVDDSLRSSTGGESALSSVAEKKVPEKESRVLVKHTGESARLTPAPTPAPAPAPKLETSTSSTSSVCSAVSRRRRPLKSAMARTCAGTTTTTATATSTPKPPKKTVQFSHLEIRTYPVTLGDNPSVSSGPPLTLDWNY